MMTSEIHGEVAPENAPLIHTSSVTGDPIVQVAFWGPDEGPTANRALCNTLTACWTKGSEETGVGVSFTHCEMRFANGYVCSIHEYMLEQNPLPRANEGGIVMHAVPPRAEVEGRVHCRPRELDRKRYHFIDFTMSAAQHTAMFNWALSYQRQRIPFNQAGMRLNFVWPFRWFPLDRKETAFFCSELMVTLMHKGGMALDLVACTTSPNSLWTYMSTSMKNAAPGSYNRNSAAPALLASVKSYVAHPDASNGKKHIFKIN